MATDKGLEEIPESMSRISDWIKLQAHIVLALAFFLCLYADLFLP